MKIRSVFPGFRVNFEKKCKKRQKRQKKVLWTSLKIISQLIFAQKCQKTLIYLKNDEKIKKKCEKQKNRVFYHNLTNKMKKSVLLLFFLFLYKIVKKI